MMKYAVIIFTLFVSNVNAQTYKDSIDEHRKHYKEDFIKEERSPLKGNDTSLLRFYAADKKYRVTADFTLTPDSPSFDMPTYSGKTKKFRQYGIAYFTIDKKKVSLRVFQNLKLLDDDKYKNHLFIPFTDATAYTETYAGGRYIDLETTDIKEGKLVIDFNKCYNPYCMYAEGYNCPIPPVENRLPIAIRAGEKLYAGKHKTH
jgi:uncharacterized protein (DUF1684 family)